MLKFCMDSGLIIYICGLGMEVKCQNGSGECLKCIEHYVGHDQETHVGRAAYMYVDQLASIWKGEHTYSRDVMSFCDKWGDLFGQKKDPFTRADSTGYRLVSYTRSTTCGVVVPYASHIIYIYTHAYDMLSLQASDICGSGVMSFILLCLVFLF